jgi:hypothetical protein
MNTATPSTGMITPLKALWRWLVATPGVAQTPGGRTQQLQTSAHCGSTLRNHVLRGGSHVPTPPVLRRPLRMVRVMEAGQAPWQVGRMVISGRMADVCAELDRLAAHEARLH